MISGIGVDLVDKARFINLVKKFGNRVATKILSKDEYLEYKIISNKPSFLSKRFAAKEALSKALGVGLYRKGIYPKYISDISQLNITILANPLYRYPLNLRISLILI